MYKTNCGNWCAGGQGILSKYLFEDLVWEDCPSGWFPGWIIQLNHNLLGEILMLNVHLRPPLPAGTGLPGPLQGIRTYFSSREDRKNDLMKWMETLQTFQNGTKPVIVAGDFNEESTGKSGTYLRSLGFEDGVCEYDNSITWHWPLLNGYLSVWGRYDHIFYSNLLKCTNGKVICKGQSDHYPVIIDVELKEQIK